MREFSTDEPQKIISIISTLTDNTRLEILSLLIQEREGMTAADISRRIDKKIPSTIYQLEIIQASGLIKSEMKHVSSIGREIKHWILPEENFHFLFKIDLSSIINESTLSIDVRDAYLTILQKKKSILTSADIEKFDPDILKMIILPNGAKLADKDITKILQLKADQLIIDTFIFRIRNILRNTNINDGYPKAIVMDMFGISEELANRICNELNNYFDLGYDFQSQYVFRKN